MRETMTGRERVLAVLRRKEPDVIPTFEWDIDASFIAAMTGDHNYDDFIDHAGLDAVMCSPNYRETPMGDGLVRDEWGVVRRKGHEDYPMAMDQFAPIKDWADLERWAPPDPAAPGRFDTLQRRVARFKGHKAIFIRARDVFSNPRDLMGYERFLVACLEQPDLVASLVEQCVSQSIEIVRRAAELGVEVVISGDDIADNRGPLISPRVWEKIFLPQFRRWVAAVHDCGLYYWKHTDGNIMKLIDGLVDAGIDGIDPVDPLGHMDLATIKARYGERVAIKGNVDCAHLLVEGTEEQVVAAVKACIRAAGPGGGYACSTSNSIHSGVRPELYRAMLAAIRTYGVYPLDVDRLE
jgi:uroporphyrinogen decarboxylase